jgi:hypothetical protein
MESGKDRFSCLSSLPPHSYGRKVLRSRRVDRILFPLNIDLMIFSPQALRIVLLLVADYIDVMIFSPQALIQ